MAWSLWKSIQFSTWTQNQSLARCPADQRLQQDLQVDRQRYHGLHGTAILSRYPLENAHILRLPVCYDWYASEYRSDFETGTGQTLVAHKLFRERMSANYGTAGAWR